TERALAAGRGSVMLIDGLAYGALPADLIARLASPIVALVHHPLYLETGLSCARRSALRALEAAALALAERAVVTSATTARILRQRLAVPAGKITVAEPGTARAPRAVGSGAQELELLAVGAVVPRKAYDTLVHALAPLARRRWHLTIAGPMDRSDAAVASL